MIDLEKEEFLQRFDLRVHVIASILEYHEKWLAATITSGRSDSREIMKNIEGAKKDAWECLCKLDEQVREHFEKLKNELNGGER